MFGRAWGAIARGARRAEIFAAPVEDEGPWARLIRGIDYLRILLVVVALSVTIAARDPTFTHTERVAAGLFTAVFWLPCAAGLLAARRRSLPLLRTLALLGDTVVLFILQTTFPPARPVVLPAYMLVIALNTPLGGLPAGLAVAGAAVSFTVLAQLKDPAPPVVGVPSLIVFGGILLALVLVLDSATREQRLANSRRVSTLSHEIRNPLTSVAGFASTLLARWGEMEDPDRLRAVEAIARNADELRRITEELLEAARLDGLPVLHPRPVLLRDAAEKVIAAHALALANHLVILEIPSGLAVHADEHVVWRVLGNLVTNAAKYSPQGSPIRLDAKVVGADIEVSVIDRGAGIPLKEQEQIFEPWFRSSTVAPGVKGTGLGLAIVRRSLERSAGRIRVTSRPGQGSTFRFTLPRAVEAEVQRPA